MKNWWYSILLAVVYVAIFRFWAMNPHSESVYKISALIVCPPLLIAMWWAGLRGYFRGATDFVAHLLVVLDILAEGLIAVHHPPWDGVWCAIAFALVIGPYHAMRLRTDQVNSAAIAEYGQQAAGGANNL